MKYLVEIQKHFQETYPREGCGILGVQRGELKWFPCVNIADDDQDFVFEPSEYINIAQKCDITAIVHSHPDGNSEASSADIKQCNILGIPYYIFSYPEMELTVIKPENAPVRELMGREYEFGVTDCFEAIRDYLITQNLVIPQRYVFGERWWEKGEDYFCDTLASEFNGVPVSGNYQKNDILIFSVYSSVPNHCGVYLGDDIFYHHATGRLSCRENLYPYWKKFLVKGYRYAA